jgi:hypothetical protein
MAMMMMFIWVHTGGMAIKLTGSEHLCANSPAFSSNAIPAMRNKQ